MSDEFVPLLGSGDTDWLFRRAVIGPISKRELQLFP